jgi:hypothetical protein
LQPVDLFLRGLRRENNLLCVDSMPRSVGPRRARAWSILRGVVGVAALTVRG